MVTCSPRTSPYRWLLYRAGHLQLGCTHYRSWSLVRRCARQYHVRHTFREHHPTAGCCTERDICNWAARITAAGRSYVDVSDSIMFDTHSENITLPPVVVPSGTSATGLHALPQLVARTSMCATVSCLTHIPRTSPYRRLLYRAGHMQLGCTHYRSWSLVRRCVRQYHV